MQNINKHLSESQKAVLKSEIAKELKKELHVEVMPFGKFKGVKYEDIPLHYLQWLMSIKDKLYRPMNEFMFTD